MEIVHVTSIFRIASAAFERDEIRSNRKIERPTRGINGPPGKCTIQRRRTIRALLF
jgi:hypothetical protein